jgi:hypothetical protein
MDQQVEGFLDTDFEKHQREQLSEIHSDFNHHITKEKLGYEPDPNELALNYVNSGGAKRLAIKNGRDVEGADL